MPDVDFNYFLNRKYAQLQQQADADTSRASSALIGANAGAVASAAAANLDNARAAVVPGESASTIGLQGAQAGLLRTQAQVLPGTAASENALRASQTGLTNVQGATAATFLKTGIMGGPAGSTPLPSLSAGGASTPVASPLDIAAPSIGSQTSTPTAQRPGETYAAWLTRLRGSGF